MAPPPEWKKILVKAEGHETRAGLRDIHGNCPIAIIKPRPGRTPRPRPLCGSQFQTRTAAYSAPRALPECLYPGAELPSEYVASARELSQARQFGACLKDAYDDFENSTIPIFAYVRGCAFP